MAGRKRSPDKATAMSIYPVKSLRERAIKQAEVVGEKPAQYAVEALRQRVERDEAKPT